MLKNLWIIFLLYTQSLFSESHIRGDISLVRFDSSSGPFVVDSDIVIPNGKKVIINRGSKLFFSPYSGLLIEGTLIVEGTLEYPVVFSCIHDSLHQPGDTTLPIPFDWNGIFVSKTAEQVTLKNSIIQFSTYGIKTQTKALALESCVFRSNGQFNFTINDKIMPAVNNIPFTYTTENPPRENTTITRMNYLDNSNPRQNIELKSEKKAVNRRINRYFALGSTIPLTAGSIMFVLSRRDYAQADKAFSELSKYLDKNHPEYIAKNMEYDQKQRSGKNKTTVSLILLGLGIVTGGVGIKFDF